MRSVQPPVFYGQSVEDLPPRLLGRLHGNTFAAFTGPNGGLASVNRSTQALNINEPDVDYIDSDDIQLDAQPNAYVTSQKPPPRKSPFSDIAAYFKRPSPAINNDRITTVSHNRINNNYNNRKRVRDYDSQDSLDCDVPAWRGEAPSPLSPHPARAPPNAFLHFGDGPLNYGLAVHNSLPNQRVSINSECNGSIVDYAGTRSCENLFTSNKSPINHNNGDHHNNQDLCGGSLGSLEGLTSSEDHVKTGDSVMLVSCQDGQGSTVNRLLLDSCPDTPVVDQNYNPLIMVEGAGGVGVPLQTQSMPITPRNNVYQISNIPNCDVQSAPVTPRNLQQAAMNGNNDDDDAITPTNPPQHMNDFTHPRNHSHNRLSSSMSNGNFNLHSSRGNDNSSSFLNGNYKKSCSRDAMMCGAKNPASAAAAASAGKRGDDGGLACHRAKFLTLELVEGGALAGQSV